MLSTARAIQVLDFGVTTPVADNLLSPWNVFSAAVRRAVITIYIQARTISVQCSLRSDNSSVIGDVLNGRVRQRWPRTRTYATIDATWTLELTLEPAQPQQRSEDQKHPQYQDQH